MWVYRHSNFRGGLRQITSVVVDYGTYRKRVGYAKGFLAGRFLYFSEIMVTELADGCDDNVIYIYKGSHATPSL